MILEKNTSVFAISWYDFKKGASVLCVEEKESVFSDFLAKKGYAVKSVSIRKSACEPFLVENCSRYDYIVAIGILEKCLTPSVPLSHWFKLLKDDGVLLLATPNRLGIQFFCGDRDPVTHRVFDGIENYARQPSPLAKNMGGKLYARDELESLLTDAGFCRRKFYSVYPNLQVPQLIYADGFSPNEDLNTRVLPRYNDCSGIFMDERILYDSLVKNNLFHQMANAFFIECPKMSDFSKVSHVTLPVFRSQDAFATIIFEEGLVKKRVLDEEGMGKLRVLLNNAMDLRAHGIKTVDMELAGNSLVMPYVDAPLALYYLRDLLCKDTDKFILEMDRIKELIESSSDNVSSDSNSVVLKHGYIDLVPINAFYKDNEYCFFDQEFCYENLPASVIILRFILFIYDGHPQLNTMIPQRFFLDRYKIDNVPALFSEYIDPFMNRLLNKNEFLKFNERTAQKKKLVDFNNRVINSGFMEMVDSENLVASCFNNINKKKIVVFGAGKYADKFLAFYKDDYDIECVVDNDLEKQGSFLRGVKVCSPEVLQGLDHESLKVIICMKSFKSVYFQLRSLGIKNIGVYDANRIYPGRQTLVPMLLDANKNQPSKKYRIGYVAGVFDLYHLGHLNMFRRAKEQCDYLIVGVTSDRYVVERKHKEPFIPFEERLELVRSCKYVDEAREIPFEYGGTVDAFQKYHFDVQFSGSDYVNHPWWLAQQKWLREHGADLVFFPYTEQTSSTKIKALIEKGLL